MTDRQRLNVFAPVAAFCVIAAFGIGVIGMAAFDGGGGSPATTPVAAAGASNVIDVALGDLYIEPETLHAEPGDVTINVTNEGKIPHNIAFVELGASKMLDPGVTETIVLGDVEEGRYGFVCEVPGHGDGGMKGNLLVHEGEEEDAAADPHEGMTPEQMVEADAAVTGRFPAETKGKGGIPLEPEIAADGTKVFKLTADEIKWEVEPGVTHEGLAYNGMIPGPQLNAELGDKVRIELTNEMEQPTSMHFHGLRVPVEMDGVPVISQDAIMPGDSFTYEFTIRDTGSHMYHSHFMAQEQVPAGLLGAIVVTDEKDPKVDLDYTMVLNDGPLGFTINGKGFPATEPIVLEKGQRVRIRYMNEGLQIHPMHLHGMPQQVVSKDGHILPRPYMADTILVGPGERYDVIVKADEPGIWAFHCHVLTHADGPTGMFGMVTAMIVE